MMMHELSGITFPDESSFSSKTRASRQRVQDLNSSARRKRTEPSIQQKSWLREELWTSLRGNCFVCVVDTSNLHLIWLLFSDCLAKRLHQNVSYISADHRGHDDHDIPRWSDNRQQEFYLIRQWNTQWFAAGKFA